MKNAGKKGDIEKRGTSGKFSLETAGLEGVRKSKTAKRIPKGKKNPLKRLKRNAFSHSEHKRKNHLRDSTGGENVQAGSKRVYGRRDRGRGSIKLSCLLLKQQHGLGKKGGFTKRTSQEGINPQRINTRNPLPRQVKQCRN